MSIRYIILAAMFAVGFILLQNWSKFAEQRAVETLNATPANTQTIIDNSGEIPQVTTVSDTAEPVVKSNEISKHIIQVETDVFSIQIDPRGGDLVYAALKQHKKALNSQEPFVIIENTAQRLYLLQSGLVGNNGTDTTEGRPLFTSAQQEYRLAADQEELRVNLDYVQADNTVITKQFVFKPNDYSVGLNYLINNQSANNWSGVFYGQIKRDTSPDPSSQTGAGGLGLQPFLGVATRTEKERFEKFDFEDIEKKPFSQKLSDAWIAMIQHYFLSAWVAPKGQEYEYTTLRTQQNHYLARLTSPAVNIAAGQQGEISTVFYIGPKDQYELEKIAPGLDLSVDYSFLWWIAQPLYSLLNFFATGRLHMFDFDKQIFPGFGNWGLAIIFLTILVKLLFFKLNQKAYGSMARMKKFAPKMQSIKDQHPDDRQKQSQAMMELYRKEKINPMGGCLPMLVQMPVFLALYWVLMESVELRHAPFFGWIQDLSTKDPLFILPIIMGASMFFQQKLNPMSADPMQAKVMQWLPVIFTVFFLFFPAGLVLYWVVNNLLSIAQQWIITRQIQQEETTKTANA